MDILAFFGMAFFAVFVGMKEIDRKDYGHAAALFAISLIAGMAGAAAMVAYAIK